MADIVSESCRNDQRARAPRPSQNLVDCVASFLPEHRHRRIGDHDAATTRDRSLIAKLARNTMQVTKLTNGLVNCQVWCLRGASNRQRSLRCQDVGRTAFFRTRSVALTSSVQASGDLGESDSEG